MCISFGDFEVPLGGYLQISHKRPLYMNIKRWNYSFDLMGTPKVLIASETLTSGSLVFLSLSLSKFLKRKKCVKSDHKMLLNLVYFGAIKYHMLNHGFVLGS